MQKFEFLRTPPFNPNNLNDTVEIESMYVETTLESEHEVITAIHEARNQYYKEVGTRPSKLVLGASKYEQLIGYQNRMGGGVVLPKAFMDMEIVVVEAPIMEVAGSVPQQFGRLYGRKRK